MNVYDLKDQEGRIFAFEVDLSLLQGAYRIYRRTEQIPNVRILRKPRWISFDKDGVRCEFEIEAHRFVVLEPFGDNSRYWVGPAEGGQWHPQIDVIRKSFIEH